MQKYTHPTFLLAAAWRMPKLAIAVVLLALVVVASVMTYTGFLVVGVVAEYLGTGRIIAGMLLGILFARVPWIRKGKFRIVGLLPKPARRPVILGLLALCLLNFLWLGDYVPALLIGLTTAFLLVFPWVRRAVLGRIVSSVVKTTGGQHRSSDNDGNVIDGEFREKKD